MTLLRWGRFNVKFLPRLGSFWIGFHYSCRYRAVCVGILPCLIIRVGWTEYVPDPDIFQSNQRDTFYAGASEEDINRTWEELSGKVC